MPIKGLSDRKRLPRLGKLHLGVKKLSAKGIEYPSATDHFVCPPEVQEIYGAEPKQLHILIPVEDEERWASQYYRCYSRTRGLICKGDGEISLIRLMDKETGTLATKDSQQVELKEGLPCQGRECPEYGRQCREVMNLQFLLPDVPGLGIWQVDTGSVNSIQNINSAADLIRGICGRVSMIPLILTLEPQEVTAEGKRKTVHTLHLRVKNTLWDIMRQASIPIAQALLPPVANGIVEDVDLPTPDGEIPEPPPQEEEPSFEPPLEPKSHVGEWRQDFVDRAKALKPVAKAILPFAKRKEITDTAKLHGKSPIEVYALIRKLLKRGPQDMVALEELTTEQAEQLMEELKGTP